MYFTQSFKKYFSIDESYWKITSNDTDVAKNIFEKFWKILKKLKCEILQYIVVFCLTKLQDVVKMGCDKYFYGGRKNASYQKKW